jgi:hypothetical protein
MYITNNFCYLTVYYSASILKIEIVFEDEIDRIIFQLDDVVEERLYLFCV